MASLIGLSIKQTRSASNHSSAPNLQVHIDQYFSDANDEALNWTTFTENLKPIETFLWKVIENEFHILGTCSIFIISLRFLDDLCQRLLNLNLCTVDYNVILKRSSFMIVVIGLGFRKFLCFSNDQEEDHYINCLTLALALFLVKRYWVQIESLD